MSTLILFVVVIAILILVHEWGHFYSARKFGVKVEEFGVGFPPRIFSRVKDGVRYSLNLLPLGGFVKIFGEHGEGEGDPGSFISRPASQRFVILAAGVFMNFLLAWVLFSVGAVLGVPGEADKGEPAPVSIIAVLPGSPAEEAGLRIGDKILEMRLGDFSRKIEREEDVRKFVEDYGGQEVVLSVLRGGEAKEISAIPRTDFPADEGPLGIALARIAIKKVPWYFAPFEGLRSTIGAAVATVYGLTSIMKDVVLEGRTEIPVAGPVGIFSLAGDIRALGFIYFIQFAAVLSVNLAILNFLPIPALDGGRILFLVIERIRGRKIDPRVESWIHAAGFAALILLMTLITYRDIVRIL